MLTLDIKSDTTAKFKLFLKRTHNPELFFEEFFEFKINQLKNGIFTQKADLAIFEKKYNLSSSEFYEQFNSGSLGDEPDYMLWSGTYEMYLENINQMQELE